MTTSNDASQSQIHRFPELLAQLDPGRSPPWTVVGTTLVELDAAGYPDHHQGQEPWLDTVIKPLGIRRASGWRYRAIARDWTWLTEQLRGAGVKVPNLPDLDPRVSPEQLEILVRLVKTADADIWAPLAHGILNRSATLHEVRRTWSHYRPVLRGKTARGRSSGGFVQQVSIDHADHQTQMAAYNSRTRHLLERTYPALLERHAGRQIASICFYQLDPDELLRCLRDEDGTPAQYWPLHAVAAVQFSGDFTSLLHGFLITPHPEKFDSMTAAPRVVDALWQVAPREHDVRRDSGLIVCDGQQFTRIKAPHQSSLTRCGCDSDLLMRYLLRPSMTPCHATPRNVRDAAFENPFTNPSDHGDHHE